MGVVLAASTKYEQALIKFKIAVNLNKSFPDGYYNIATTLVNIFKYTEALDYFHKCLEIKNDYFDAYFTFS